MYSPIREDLMPRIREAAQYAGVSMAEWVNRSVELALEESERFWPTGKEVAPRGKALPSQARLVGGRAGTPSTIPEAPRKS